MQAVIHRPAAKQLSNVQLREWQRYRGWTVKILEDLEHSGGKTTREISDGIGYRCIRTSDYLQRMLKIGLVERVERWGWRITRDGLFLLSINYNDTSTTLLRHNNDTTTTQEKSEAAPPCFALTLCHIKRLAREKRYNARNMALCSGTAQCIWHAAGKDRVPVEMKVKGVA